MPTPTTVVLFGATGDLAQRKLLPGLLHLFQSGLLHEVQVVGTSLEEHDRDSFVEFARKAIAEFGGEGPDPEGWEEFSKRLRWAPGAGGAEALRATVAEAEARVRRPSELRRLHYLSVPPKAALPVVHLLTDAGLVERSRIIMEKPFGTDLASREEAERRAARGLRRGADLPDRPLPRQGGGAEHPGLPVRQRALRADLAPQPHRPRPDRRARGARARAARALLRGHRRLPRHGGHPPVPGAGLHRDGAADGPGAAGDQRGEEQGLPLDAADRAARRGPRPVRRLPRHRGRRARLRDRDVRRAQVLRRQLALGRRAVLPAHRQADGRGGPDHLDRVPRAAALDVPARLAASATTGPTTSPSTSPTSPRCRCRSTASAPARACSWTSCRCSSRCTRPAGPARCSRPTSG